MKYASDSVWALKNINFQADKGKLILFAGASGSGKSTLAQALLGLIPSFINAEISGEIWLNNFRLNDLTRKEKLQNIGYLPQYPADYTISLLVEEEIAFPLENFRFSKLEVALRIDKILTKLNILNLKNRLITELSSGELQKVALATILAIKPPLLILDEPIARIDSYSEIIIANLLRELALEGHLVLLFEHRLDYLLPLIDYMIILEKGVIIAEGLPNDLLDHLKNVDIPEVSRISKKILFPRSLNINDAFTRIISKLNSI